jgi:hypothetical protein
MASDTAAKGEAAAGTAADDTRLCTACGLCCDGSLFSAVRLGAAEIAPLQRLGLVIEQGNDPCFRQPCVKLVDRTCSIYAERPGICHTFACALLKRMHGGGIALEEALGVVATAQSLRDKVVAAMPDPVGTAAWTAAEPDKAWSQIADPDARRSAARRHLDQVVLLEYLAKHFRSAPDKADAGGTER